MQHIGSILDRATSHLAADLTAEDAATIEDILDAAAAWADGALPWYEAAKIGAMTYQTATGKTAESSGYGRYRALRFTPADDPRRAALVRLVDDLVRRQGCEVTRQGVFDRDELADHGATMR
jgi:hypothetical protein